MYLVTFVLRLHLWSLLRLVFKFDFGRVLRYYISKYWSQANEKLSAAPLLTIPIASIAIFAAQSVSMK